MLILTKAIVGEFLTLRSFIFWFSEVSASETSNYFFLELCVTVHLYSIIFNAESQWA